MNLQSMIEREEGRKYKAYRCTRGVWTIGIGHTGPEVHEGLVWTDAQIDAAYLIDIGEAIDGCTSSLGAWFTALNAPRQAVLVGMAFQMGTIGMLGFRNTLASVRDGRYAEASKGMRDSKWGVQTPGRVGRMSDQMLTGNWA